MNSNCWICGAPADSAEHRFKKSDLVRAHGRGPYKESTALSHIRAGKEVLVQGPNSKLLKYPPNLCQYCNSTITQPFDKAYERFVDWILENEADVLHRRFVNFQEIYGNCWADAQLNLYKYFAKSFGCRLVDSGSSVPDDIVGLFGLNNFQTHLRLSMAVNEDVLLMPKKDRNGFVSKGDLFYVTPRSEPTLIESYIWNEAVSWLTVCYWYNYVPNGSFGSTWVADAQFIYFGSFYPLDEDSRLDYIEKVKKRQNI